VTERPARARLFVALDLPAPVRAELAAWGARVTGDRDGLRPLDVDALHVTLCFLGWREASEVEAIGQAVLPCAGPAPELGIGAPAWLPPRRPGVLVVDLEDLAHTLVGLQRRVSDALVAAVGYEPERRAFRPHVTVARVRRRARLRPFALAAPDVAPFAGRALTLYRSCLGPAGARYDPLASVAL
jgi:RNA 2',3'-cyclic 3'-phosphodiesterase